MPLPADKLIINRSRPSIKQRPFSLLLIFIYKSNGAPFLVGGFGNGRYLTITIGFVFSFLMYSSITMLRQSLKALKRTLTCGFSLLRIYNCVLLMTRCFFTYLFFSSSYI